MAAPVLPVEGLNPLREAERKLKIIPTFYEKNIEAGDLDKLALPACRAAYHRPGYQLDASVQAIHDFATELSTMIMPRTNATPAVSLEGKKYLGDMLMNEEYKVCLLLHSQASIPDYLLRHSLSTM